MVHERGRDMPLVRRSRGETFGKKQKIRVVRAGRDEDEQSGDKVNVREGSARSNDGVRFRRTVDEFLVGRDHSRGVRGADFNRRKESVGEG